MNHFLLVHFTGEDTKDGEQVYFSMSKDGKNFEDLNDGFPILKSEIGRGGVRDPFLIRDKVNHCFYIIATDLRIHEGKGWQAAQNEGSMNIVVWKSEDLVNWSQPWLLPINISGGTNVWAPECIYDELKEEFFIFWATKQNGKHKIFGAFTTDFKNLSQPEIFMEKEKDVIDTTLIQHNGNWFRYSKDETTSRIISEMSDSLCGDYSEIKSSILANFEGVEGPEIIKVDENQWYLFVDRFIKRAGYTILQSNDLESGDFTILSEDEFDLGKTRKRHGGLLEITKEESDRLQKFFNQQNSSH